jgi:H+/Cl- antiporter ClcA
LWNRLFAPLVAAGAGAITTDLVAGASFSLPTPPYPGSTLVDIVLGALIGVGSAALALVATAAFHATYPLFKRIANPLLMLTLGGFVLGVLGAIGGPLTLFKGLDQVKELTANAAQYSAANLAMMTVIKTAALVIAATCGFRGGRIFPSVFIGTAFGMCFATLVPSVHEALAISCGVLGIVMVVTRQGWISLFVAAILVPDAGLLPVLVLISLPIWLLVVGRPMMLISRQEAIEA